MPRCKTAPTARLLRSESQALSRLQQHLLPPHVPQPPGWRLAAYALLGAWPGGDFYDFLPLPDGRLAFVVADASGHGAPAAVLAAQLRTVLHSCPFRLEQAWGAACPRWHAVPQPPAGPGCAVGWCPVTQPLPVVLARLSQILEANSLDEQFLTAFFGVLSPGSGLVRYANAGHPPPRWWHATDGSVTRVPNGAGPPLGLGLGGDYGEGTIALNPGDLLVCYTDGLTEAPDGDQEFGRERLDTAIREVAPRGAGSVKARILAALDRFLAGASLADDVTLVALERTE